MSRRFQNIINHYKKLKNINPDTWIEACTTKTNLDDAIQQAASCLNDDQKKHPHQYRLKNINLSQFADAILKKKKDIQQSQNFEELFEIVNSCRVFGIGELAIYDTTVRIGAFLDIWPERIYLHAGARVGAEALLGSTLESVIEKQDLPEEFRNSDLNCFELEDLLCIYKKMFQRRNF